MTGSPPADPSGRHPDPRRPLRWVVAVLVLTAIPLVHFQVGPVVRVLLDAGHYPLFGLITLLAYRAVRTFAAPRRAGATAAIVSMGAGVLVEAIQSVTGRTASVQDLLADLAGTLATLAGIAVWGHGTRLAPRVAHGAAALAVLGALLAPVWPEWLAVRWRDENFPLLADFEDPAQLRLWHTQGGTGDRVGSVQRSDAPQRDGHALAVRTVEGDWGGAHLDLGRMDWSAFAELQLQVYNPGAPFLLRVLVDDADTNDNGKYVLRTTVSTGWTELRVPIEQMRRDRFGQHVDFTRVSSLRVFAGAHQPARLFYLDEIRLVGAHVD